MIKLHKKVLRAALEDTGLSGHQEADEFVGFFTLEKSAMVVARRQAGDRSVTGKIPKVTVEVIDVKIYESVEEYDKSFRGALVESAKRKLTDEEYSALVEDVLKPND